MSKYVLSHSTVFNSLQTPWTAARQAPHSMGFPRQEYWSGLSFPPPGIFLIQELNPALSLSLSFTHCRQILYHLSHRGSPWIRTEDIKKHFWKLIEAMWTDRKRREILESEILESSFCNLLAGREDECTKPSYIIQIPVFTYLVPLRK